MNIRKINGKKAIEFSFAWLFAAVIGAFILFLAIYAAAKLISTSESGTNAIAAEQIGVLLNPLETSFETAQVTDLSTPSETRIYNDCKNFSASEPFGAQQIRVSQKSFGKWTDPNIAAEFQNKYIFSQSYEEGQNFFVFSKPFDLPFKVADLIMLSSSQKQYCFIGAPNSIKTELNELNQSNLMAGNCSATTAKVCFETNTGVKCDVNVRYAQGYLDKNGTRLYFQGDGLMYAAVFSDKNVYECQVKRLVLRAEELSSLYSRKSSLINSKGCGQGVDLGLFEYLLQNYNDSSDLGQLNFQANSIQQNNENLACRLW